MPRVDCLEATLLHLRSHSCLRHHITAYYGMRPTSPFRENAFNPLVAPPGLAPQTQVPISLPTSRYSVACAAVPSVANRPSLRTSAQPPFRSNRLRRSKHERENAVYPEKKTLIRTSYLSPKQLTVVTPLPLPRLRSPYFLSEMHGGSSSHMAPLQLGHHQRSSPTSGDHHQLHPGYPTVHVGTVDERDATRRTVDDGQGSNGFSVAQQQQRVARYSTRQHQNQSQAHWCGAQLTNVSLSQPSQPTHGYSTPADPSYPQHARHVHAPMRNPSMYAAPILTTPH